MVLTPVNLYKYPGEGSQSDAGIKPMRHPPEPTWLSSSHWEQTMHVSVQWVHWGPASVSCASWYQCQCWHCHILVTVSCLAWHRDYLASRHTLSNKSKIMSSFPSPHWSPTLNTGLWLAPNNTALTRYLHNFSFISVRWLGPAQYTEDNEYSSPEEWSACDVWLLRYSNIKCDNNDPRDITAASLYMSPH